MDTEIRLYSDTRQQKGKHRNIDEYCRKNNIEMIPVCLPVGDYMLVDNPKVSVDTKQDLIELASDLIRDKLAFFKKYKKCYEQKIRLIVLIEDDNFSRLEDVYKWKNPHTKNKKLALSGKKLMELMHEVKISYGVEFVFCNKRDTGKTLIELLRR